MEVNWLKSVESEGVLSNLGNLSTVAVTVVTVVVLPVSANVGILLIKVI